MLHSTLPTSSLHFIKVALQTAMCHTVYVFCPNSFTCKYLLQRVIGLVQSFWFLKHSSWIFWRCPESGLSCGWAGCLGARSHRVPKSLGTTLCACKQQAEPWPGALLLQAGRAVWAAAGTAAQDVDQTPGPSLALCRNNILLFVSLFLKDLLQIWLQAWSQPLECSQPARWHTQKKIDSPFPLKPINPNWGNISGSVVSSYYFSLCLQIFFHWSFYT